MNYSSSTSVTTHVKYHTKNARYPHLYDSTHQDLAWEPDKSTEFTFALADASAPPPFKPAPTCPGTGRANHNHLSHIGRSRFEKSHVTALSGRRSVTHQAQETQIQLSN